MGQRVAVAGDHAGGVAVLQERQPVQSVVGPSFERAVGQVGPDQLAGGVIRVACDAALRVRHGQLVAEGIERVNRDAGGGGDGGAVTCRVVQIADGVPSGSVRDSSRSARRTCSRSCRALGNGLALAGESVRERQRGRIGEVLGGQAIALIVIEGECVAVEIRGADDVADRVVLRGRAVRLLPGQRRQDGRRAQAATIVLPERLMEVGVFPAEQVAGFIVSVFGAVVEGVDDGGEPSGGVVLVVSRPAGLSVWASTWPRLSRVTMVLVPSA